MLISVDLIDEARGVRLTAAGPISGDELVAAHRHIEQQRHREFAACDYWLSDYSETRGEGVQAEHARGIAEITRALSRINTEPCVRSTGQAQSARTDWALSGTRAREAAEMELRLELVDAGRGIRLTTEGIVPGNLIVRAHRAILEDHLDRFADVRYWFSDHSRLRALEIDAEDAREVAWIGRNLARANPGLVVANLASGDLEYGVVRMWQAHVDDLGWRARTSRDETQLLAWMRELLGPDIDPRSTSLSLFRAGPTPESD